LSKSMRHRSLEPMPALDLDGAECSFTCAGDECGSGSRGAC
jgi:hypothetical protein